MKIRKIGVITGSRAEYGHLFWIIRGIHEDSALELQLIVTGAHLSPEFGLTIKEIERDGFPIAEKVEMLLSSDTEEAIATSMGVGMIGFAKAYSRLKLDMIVVLGDRFELFTAVSAAIPFRIPVAHIHGGETTEGAFDEQLRNAIAKMSHIHFVSTEDYKKRIIQMGENPRNVFCLGAPGIDNIIKLNLLDHKRLCKELNIPEVERIGTVTYHPVTLECNTAERQIVELLTVLKRKDSVFWIFTMSNADTNSRIIIKKIREFINEYPQRARLYLSLGPTKYLSLLKNASLMVGNSSSGLTEAPSFKLPVVNIGDRQKGRIRAANVIDVKECREEFILEAINKALSSKFKESLKGLKNPYGNGGASEKIVSILRQLPIDEKLIKKEFYNIGISNSLEHQIIFEDIKSKNIFWHNSRINRLDREKINCHKGVIIWLTGLPCSGKSTIAIHLEHALFSKGINTYILDGDNIRTGLNRNLGFSPDERAENIRRVSEVAKLFLDAGVVVITALISPYKREREVARNLVQKGDFLETFIDCPINICEQRDVKGLYAKARKGEIDSFTGVSAPYEPPDNPELHLHTDLLSIDDSVQAIISYLECHNYIPNDKSNKEKKR